MPKNPLSHSDISERQQNELNRALSTRNKDNITTSEEVQMARFGQTIYEVPVTRDQTRVLLISRDEGLLSGGASSINGYLGLEDVFDEVHILLLRTNKNQVRFPVLRLSAKVWLYIASAKDWWRTPFSALAIIDKHLAFAEGFRADIIIAHDPFESALVATIASGRYDRPYQIHVLHDFYHPHFLQQDDHPRWRRLLANYLLKRCLSVRTTSSQVCQMVQGRFPQIPDVALLPKFNQFESTLADPIKYDLKKQYPKFILTILYIGSLNHNNLVHQIIDGIRPICDDFYVGLVILGSGPAKTDLQKRVKKLKLDRHVVFEETVSKQVDYLKSCDVLIVTENTSASDDLVIQGAVYNTAMVVVPTTIRKDLFDHNTSILFFEDGKSAMITAHLRELATKRQLVQQLANSAREVVVKQLYTDVIIYRQTYRASIERTLFVKDELIKTKQAK